MSTTVAPVDFRAVLHTPAETAEYLGVQSQTLAVWRMSGKYGLPFVKVGRLVRYRQSDIERFVERRTIGGNNSLEVQK